MAGGERASLFYFSHFLVGDHYRLGVAGPRDDTGQVSWLMPDIEDGPGGNDELDAGRTGALDRS